MGLVVTRICLLSLNVVRYFMRKMFQTHQQFSTTKLGSNGTGVRPTNNPRIFNPTLWGRIPT